MFLLIAALAVAVVYVVVRRMRAPGPHHDGPGYQELLKMARNRDTCERLIQGELRRNPELTREECIQLALDRLGYDRSRRY